MKRLFPILILSPSLAGLVGAQQRADLGKSLVEQPIKERLDRSEERRTKRKTPRVSAGLVRWHQSFASARARSAKSGKPVMLFQLLGRLDDEFC